MDAGQCRLEFAGPRHKISQLAFQISDSPLARPLSVQNKVLNKSCRPRALSRPFAALRKFICTEKGHATFEQGW